MKRQRAEPEKGLQVRRVRGIHSKFCEDSLMGRQFYLSGEGAMSWDGSKARETTSVNCLLWEGGLVRVRKPPFLLQATAKKHHGKGAVSKAVRKKAKCG